jgi:hypothetical protein
MHIRSISTWNNKVVLGVRIFSLEFVILQSTDIRVLQISRARQPQGTSYHRYQNLAGTRYLAPSLA